MSQRSRPNVLVTGTPGVGKTTMCELLAEEAGMKHINFGSILLEGGFNAGYNAEFDTHDVTEENLADACDSIEAAMGEGGVILDYASCDYFPERWFDLVVVLVAETNSLFPRLEARGYSKKKVTENMQAEIFQVVLQDAYELYPNVRKETLTSNTVDEMQENIASIQQMLQEVGSAAK
ncbi:adenylate kinase isoenzyme 6 [Thecamonas trahens ATCC 50062]|uniref:Adenylate kinase isoenzyme 6 homolog n=1 Tax=Thecamonas trahens ATCC 50062 TaxID=461836 RepID=A0A0L0DFT2_THETB|nr:adenylate kinase isoenzyme 6 [Thecamonas trahens ATCC 50062]KNC50178.1 adenylate kinase isoenzyme 6 [Thecamonas trahens ATCC 50062]|eukprot:XP_013757016.1 adenylate kinase isoenzyme 6 [Thecamonas trahens ATCC 50062]